jgi:hypothetical protein
MFGDGMKHHGDSTDVSLGCGHPNCDDGDTCPNCETIVYRPAPLWNTDKEVVSLSVLSGGVWLCPENHLNPVPDSGGWCDCLICGWKCRLVTE